MKDRLVIGLKSKELSEKLQLREDLILEKAVKIVRSYEQVKTQMEEMQDNSVDAVTGERKETIKHPGWKNYTQKTVNATRCKKCHKYHKFGNYPAKGKIRGNSYKMNQFAICWSRTQNIRDIQKQPTVRYFFGSICKNEFPEKKIDYFYIKLKVGEIPIILKIDTGADINVIRTKTFRKLRKKTNSKTSTLHL